MIDKEIELLQEETINNFKNKKIQLEFDFSVKKSEAEVCQVVGATCQSCQEHYPYAELKKDFKCWSCRNF